MMRRMLRFCKVIPGDGNTEIMLLIISIIRIKMIMIVLIFIMNGAYDDNNSLKVVKEVMNEIRHD